MTPPNFCNYRLSRGYDKFYSLPGQECGKESGYQAQCDVLINHCSAPAPGQHEWNTKGERSRRFFKISTRSDVDVIVKCFYEHKRKEDEEMSEPFEVAFDSLKTLLKDNMVLSEMTEAERQLYRSMVER